VLWQALFWRTKCQHSLAPVYLYVWRTTSTSRHWSQTTTTFCLINVSGCSTYSSVYCRWQSVSCYSRSSVEQSSIARHCCPPLSVFCCRLKSHLFSLSYPAFWLFSHLYGASVVIRQCECQMSKTFIGGAVCREFDSEAPVAEENVRREQFSLYMCLENGDYITWTI